jgi:hypothetical protein
MTLMALLVLRLVPLTRSSFLNTMGPGIGPARRDLPLIIANANLGTIRGAGAAGLAYGMTARGALEEFVAVVVVGPASADVAAGAGGGCRGDRREEDGERCGKQAKGLGELHFEQILGWFSI